MIKLSHPFGQSSVIEVVRLLTFAGVDCRSVLLDARHLITASGKRKRETGDRKGDREAKRVRWERDRAEGPWT